VQENSSATQRQTKRNSVKQKSNRIQLPSCGAVETTTYTKDKNNPEPTTVSTTSHNTMHWRKKCKRQRYLKLKNKKQIKRKKNLTQ